MVNVQDFGAKGDGINDDTAAIQTAIDCAYKEGRTEVTLPLGVYVISKTIYLPDGVKINGSSEKE